MLLFAHIIFVPAPVTAQSCHSNRFCCCFLLKAGQGYQPPGWALDREPRFNPAWLPVFAFARVAPGRNQQSISVIFVFFWMPVVWQPPRHCLTTSSIQSLCLNDSFHAQRLCSHLAVHPWPAIQPTCWMCFPKFLCSSYHLPLGVSISLLTPGSSRRLHQGWLTLWLYLCLSVVKHKATGQLLTFLQDQLHGERSLGVIVLLLKITHVFFVYFVSTYFLNVPGHVKTTMISLR